MLIKNIYTQIRHDEPFSGCTKLCNKIKLNQEPGLVSVIHMPMKYDETSTYFKVNGFIYLLHEFRESVKGFTAQMLQTKDGYLIIINIDKTAPKGVDMDLITPIKGFSFDYGTPFEITPFTEYTTTLPYKSKVLKAYLEGKPADILSEKVKGTSFRDQTLCTNYNGEVEMDGEVPIIHTKAVLSPEPTNAHDPNAVAVYGQLKPDENGQSKAYHIGYVPKNSQLYNQINKTKQAILVDLDIYGYTMIQHQPYPNDSFVLRYPRSYVDNSPF